MHKNLCATDVKSNSATVTPWYDIYRRVGTNPRTSLVKRAAKSSKTNTRFTNTTRTNTRPKYTYVMFVQKHSQENNLSNATRTTCTNMMFRICTNMFQESKYSNVVFVIM